MLRMKYFTALRNMPNFQFSGCNFRPRQGKIFNGSQREHKIILNQTKPAYFLPWCRLSFARVSGKIDFDAKLSGWFLKRHPLKRFWQTNVQLSDGPFVLL